MPEETLYDRLGLQSNASSDEIKQAFRTLAKKYHPDSGETSNADKFQSIRTAYEILIDPDLRRNYNQSLRETLAKKKKERIQEVLFTIDTGTKLEIILAWSTTRPTFRTSFASSCLNSMAEGRELTPKQIEAIDRVILSFEINVDQWMNDELRNSALESFILAEEQKRPFQDFEDTI